MNKPMIEKPTMYSTKNQRPPTCVHYSPMNTTAIQTKDRSKAHRSPLRILHPTITALVVSRDRFDHCLVGGCHLYHDDDGLLLLMRWRGMGWRAGCVCIGDGESSETRSGRKQWSIQLYWFNLGLQNCPLNKIVSKWHES